MSHQSVPKYHEQRIDMALACRVLASQELADGVLGHISLQVDENALLIRCCGKHERGLAYTAEDDIHLVDFEGNPASEGELADEYSAPVESPLHAQLRRLRTDVKAVVHTCPSQVIAADLAGLTVKAVIGVFDIPGARLVARGIPVYPCGVSVQSRKLAMGMITAMQEHSVVLLRGHGLTSAAETVEEAVLQFISVDKIARLSLQIASAGGRLVELPQADMSGLSDLGASLNTYTAWQDELMRLDTA